VNARGHGNHGNGWVGGSLNPSYGTVVIDGSGTIHLKGQGYLFYVQGGDDNNVTPRKLTLDGVTLVGVDNNSEPLISIGKGGEVVLKSGAITGNTHVDKKSSGGGVYMWGGSFTMSGGTISGNSASGTAESATGGGVCIVGGEGTTFTMTGGAISGNSAMGKDWSSGGGVNVWGGGLFTMTGGTISGNTVGGTSAGGGVSISQDTVFIMEGGTIYGKADSLPAGTDTSLANSAQRDASLTVDASNSTAKWGTGGTYTKGGASQTGGSVIDGTDDTLIAVKYRRLQGQTLFGLRPMLLVECCFTLLAV
jgi:hypothetical protein